MKFLGPAGLLLILALVIIFFAPRRLPDVVKPFRRRMRVFRENGEIVRSTDSRTATPPTAPASEHPTGSDDGAPKPGDSRDADGGPTAS